MGKAIRCLCWKVERYHGSYQRAVWEHRTVLGCVLRRIRGTVFENSLGGILKNSFGKGHGSRRGVVWSNLGQVGCGLSTR